MPRPARRPIPILLCNSRDDALRLERLSLADRGGTEEQIFFRRHMMPLAIILDPATSRHTPAKLWLGSGGRAMDHGIEALCSPLGNPLVDALAAKGTADLRGGLPGPKRVSSDLASAQHVRFADIAAKPPTA
jgi:alcohol dehydrogenase class IV